MAQDHRSHRVACPECHAPIGRPCMRPSQHVAWAPHAGRVEAARAAGLYDREDPNERKRAPRISRPPCEMCGLPNSGVGEPPRCDGCFLEYARHDIGLTGPGQLYAAVVSYAREENEPDAFLTEAELCEIGSHPLVVYFDGRTGKPFKDGHGVCEACGRTVRDSDPFQDFPAEYEDESAPPDTPDTDPPDEADTHAEEARDSAYTSSELRYGDDWDEEERILSTQPPADDGS